MPQALAPRGTNGNGEFIPMTAHVECKAYAKEALAPICNRSLLFAQKRRNLFIAILYARGEQLRLLEFAGINWPILR